jgi:hypothetical protein
VERQRVRTTNWYIEPLDNKTNRIIADLVSEEDGGLIKVSNEVMPRRAYLITSKPLDLLLNSKADSNLRFNVFVQKGKGEICPADFLTVLRKKRAGHFPKLARAGR